MTELEKKFRPIEVSKSTREMKIPSEYATVLREAASQYLKNLPAGNPENELLASRLERAADLVEMANERGLVASLRRFLP